MSQHVHPSESSSLQASPKSLARSVSAESILAQTSRLHNTRPSRVMRLEAQSIARTTSPERILETSASLNDAQVAIVVPASQNLLAVPQNRTQSVGSVSEQKRQPKRTETSFSVLDLVLQTQGESFAGTTLLDPDEEGYQPYGEERRKEGSQIFLQFETKTLKLFQTLLVFHNSVRSLGSAFTLLKAADVLRTDLLMLLSLFRNNASAHLKGLSQSESRLSSMRSALSKRQEQEGRSKWKQYVSPEITNIPEGLDRLAYALSQFLARLNEVSDFAEENMNLIVDRCIQEIRYRASTLRDFGGRMSEVDVSLYANDVAGLLGDQLAAVETAVGIFMDDGIVAIRRSQDQAGSAFQNLSTVSTLLSAVTATAIQFTFNNNGNRLASRTNMLWIISLSFSIASAIHSQLAYYWTRHSHRTPSLRMTTFGSLLVVRAPFAFFVVSTVAFSGGLIAFAFLVFGSTIPKVAVICTSITIGTMILVVLWLAGEKSEPLWLKVTDFSTNVKEEFCRWIAAICSRLAKGAKPAPAPDHVSVATPGDLEWQPPGSADTERRMRSGMSEMASEVGQDGSSYEQSPFAPVDAAGAGSTALTPAITLVTAPGIPVLTFTRDHPDEVAALCTHAEVGGAPPQTVPVLQLPTLPLPPSLEPSHLDNGPPKTQRPPIPRNNSPFRRETFRLSVIKPALQHQKLARCAFKLRPYASAVRRIAFSPDGQFLASYTRATSVEMWKLDPHLHANPILLGHCRGSYTVNDLVWCPNSPQPQLLVLCGAVIALWEVEGLTLTRASSIELADSAHRVAWMPGRNHLVAVNKSKIYVIEVIDGILRLSSECPISIDSKSEMSIIDIAILPNQRIAWIIVDIKKTAENRVPLGAPERRLLEITLSNGKVKDQLPFIYPVRSIVASSDPNSDYGVITFSNKTPSLLIEKKAGSNLQTVHPFLTTSEADTAGHTTMGSLCSNGASNQIVVGADRCGTVYFWDRKTATRLHDMNTEDEAPGLAHAVWNHASSACLMLATATEDGHICLWSAPLPGAPDRART